MEKNEIKIGNQIWMTENLNVNIFCNGDAIPEARSSQEWALAGINKEPAWCFFNNNQKTAGENTGKLYNWYAVIDPRGLAPKDWHVPDKTEWFTLLNFLGKKDKYGFWLTETQMKSGYWGEYDDPSNTSGFTALPNGYRCGTEYKGDQAYYDEYTKFHGFPPLGTYDYYAHWWSSSVNEYDNPISIELAGGGKGNVRSYDQMGKEAGLAVRCIR